MKKAISIFVLLIVLSSCKEKVVEKPEKLIERDVMVDIMYDLSLLEAIRYQNPTSVEKYKTNPAEFIFKKYKIDSAQFAQNNRYYAADYVEYKAMSDEILKRIDQEKAVADSLVKLENKKKTKLKKAKITKDSLAKKDTVNPKRTQFKKQNLVKQALLKKEALQ